ncbi:MAG: YegS/Rv2252/BmrU family lipid kinase [Clostridia bacterium]
MTHLFAINPHAGYSDISEQLKSEISAVFDKKSEKYEVYLTLGSSKDREFIQNRLKKGDTVRIYACGGDGTVHDIVNAIYGFENASFAVIPCGTGNDYVKSIGGYNNLRELVEYGTEIYADLMKVNGILCMNITSMGLDADVNVNTMKHKKNPIFKGIAYYLGVLESILGKLGHKVTVKINDYDRFTTEILMLAVAKGHYYGKTFKAAPLADVADGKIDVCIVHKIPFSRIVKLLPIYQKGNHVNNAKVADVISYQKAEKINITCEHALSVSIDGEMYQEKNIEISVMPKAIKLFSLKNK